MSDPVVILTQGLWVPKSKVAAFDLDHTLIRPKGHYIHNRGPADWRWLQENIPAKLTQQQPESYRWDYDLSGG